MGRSLEVGTIGLVLARCVYSLWSTRTTLLNSCPQIKNPDKTLLLRVTAKFTKHETWYEKGGIKPLTAFTPKKRRYLVTTLRRSSRPKSIVVPLIQSKFGKDRGVYDPTAVATALKSRHPKYRQICGMHVVILLWSFTALAQVKVRS